MVSLCVLFFIACSLYFIAREKFAFVSIMVLLCVFSFFRTGAVQKIPEVAPEFLEVTTMQGVVYDIGYSEAGNQKLIVEAVLPDGMELKLYVLWTGSPHVSIGDEIQFGGTLYTFDLPRQAGGFDERTYYANQGIHYRIYATDLEKVDEVRNFHTMIYGWKEKIFESVDEKFDERYAGVVKAMITGEKDYIIIEVESLFKEGGISHILCISGLHISFFALGIGWFLQNALNFSKKRSAIFSIFFAIALLFFVGFTPSAMRAVLMISIVLFGAVCYRKGDFYNTLSGAGVCVLLLFPLNLWSVSFQLSFVTVAGIGIASRIIEIQYTWTNRFAQAFIVALYASLFSFPIVAYYFYSVSLIGILLNLLIVPVCGVLLISSVLGAIFGNPFVFVAETVFRYIETVCQIGGLVPFSYLEIGSPSIFAIVLYYAILLCASYYGKRFCNWKSLSFLMTALFFVVYGNQLIFKKNTIAFLDVGQGDSTMIRTYDNKVAFIDGGGGFFDSLGSSTGVWVLKPYLDYLGIDTIDAIFITHFDKDHCFGILEICELVDVKAIYLPEYPFTDLQYWEMLKEIVERKNIGLYTLNAGDTAIWDSYGKFECFAPVGGVGYLDGDDNHASLILKYTYGDTKVLLTGDATMEDEALVLSAGFDVRADVLKLGHHGSKYSSSTEFLEAVGADIGIASAGVNSMYNHPHEEVLERVTAEGMALYGTYELGSIFLEISKNKGYSISSMEAGKERAIYERIQSKMEK
ncbi:MAG: DNA internalization-related competence protein ComEC/Rec2 [Bacillota bacterium]